MNVPGWWAFILLVLGSYRLFRLLAEDDVLDEPRRRLLRMTKDWEADQPLPAGYRMNVALFLTCVWCLGFWICLAWWGLWQIWPHAILVISTPLALSAVAGFLRRNLDPPDE